MLVLSRKIGEKILIGDGIEVVILSIKGTQIRVGISADKSISVRREEKILPIKKANSNSLSKNIAAFLHKSKDEYLFLRRPSWPLGYLYRLDKKGVLVDFSDSGVNFIRHSFTKEECLSKDWIFLTYAQVIND